MGHSSFFEMVDLKTRCFFNIFVEDVKNPDTFSTFFVNAGGADPNTIDQGLYYARKPHSASTVWGKMLAAGI